MTGKTIAAATIDRIKPRPRPAASPDRKSTRLNSSHGYISYAVFCLKKKIDRNSGEIRFGDGVNGRIPVANVSNPGANVVASQYRFGGGKNGNVAAGALKTLLNSIPG